MWPRSNSAELPLPFERDRRAFRHAREGEVPVGPGVEEAAGVSTTICRGQAFFTTEDAPKGGLDSTREHCRGSDHGTALGPVATKNDLGDWIVEALQAQGGAAPLIDVCRFVWQHHEDELRASGDLFYSWQYDIRWAATNLRHAGVMKPAETSPTGIWELS
jgi:hypothetical protein